MWELAESVAGCNGSKVLGQVALIANRLTSQLSFQRPSFKT